MAEKSGQDPMKSIFEASTGKTSFPHVTSDLLTPRMEVWNCCGKFFCKPCCAAQSGYVGKGADIGKGGGHTPN